MLQPTRRLAELEARYGREAFRYFSYADALALFTALWAEARALLSWLSQSTVAAAVRSIHRRAIPSGAAPIAPRSCARRW